MVARRELEIGRLFRWRPNNRPDMEGSVVTVLDCTSHEPYVLVRFDHGHTAKALPVDLHRVSARRAVSLKEIAKAYDSEHGVETLERLMSR